MSIINQSPFFASSIDFLDFKLNKDQTMYEANLPDILDANNNFESINITSNELGSVIAKVGGNNTKKTGLLDYDNSTNSLKIEVGEGFNSSLVDLKTMTITLIDSLEAKTKYEEIIVKLDKYIVVVDEVVEEIIVSSWVPTYEQVLQETEKVIEEVAPEGNKLTLDFDSISNIGELILDFSEDIFID